MEHRDYRTRLAVEQNTYEEDVCVHRLPQAFHYWSNTFVRPRLEAFGLGTADDLFKTWIEKCEPGGNGPQRFLSIGSGNCDLEIEVALHLQARGRTGFVIDCVDLNAAMLERGASAAAQKGVGGCIHPIQADCNAWTPLHEYDAAMANQALHHVVRLEHVFAQVGSSLKPGGRFIVSDMIGRNGHQRWPEALVIVREFWPKLPPSHRYNWKTRRYEEMFEDYDCSQQGFEGIRSQDILPLLLDRFHFHLFFGFANVIEPFVDRSFGHNFDVTSEWDRAFIEAVNRRDEEEILSGRIKPTHMLAVLGKEPVPRLAFQDPLTPEFCVRLPDARSGQVAAGQLREDVYQWDAWPHASQQELEIACQRLKDAGGRIQELERELERMRGLIEERSRWALRLNTEVKETHAVVEERSLWALRLQGEVDELAARVRELEEEVTRLAWARRMQRYWARFVALARRVSWRRSPKC
jgi:SAM-dependent methyltransferase